MPFRLSTYHPLLSTKVREVTDHAYRYSPFSLDIESEQIGLLKTARELGVAIVAYSPIGRGMLGGEQKRADLTIERT
jgi:aryl-alcohol dehydrogenase-like predicted oxidoreductase